MISKITVCLVLCLTVSTLSAQENGNANFALETGAVLSASDSEGLAILLNLEGRVRIVDNFFAGVRFGVALNNSRYDNFEPFNYVFDRRYDNGLVAFVPNLNYYFEGVKFKESLLFPYVSVGLGYYLLYNIEIAETGSDNFFEINVPNRFGALLRGGFEVGKWRVGIEHNLMSSSDIIVPNDRIIGTVDNSYWGLTVGIVIH